jgi:ABC-type phosphate transport system substrate-binding protein
VKRTLAILSAVCGLGALAAAPSGTTIRVKGSDTIGGELGPALARAFEAASPGVTVAWESLGSATAFGGLLDGSADLGASSRPVSDDELARTRELGVELREFVLGYDGVVLIVNPSNPVRRLTIPQLSALLSGAVRSWAELGGKDLKPRLYGRPRYSGTHVFVRDRVVRRGERGAPDGFAAETLELEHSAALVTAVAKDPAAIAYVGMGWVRPGVAPLAVAPAAGAPYVSASVETVRSGAYPIARPLLLYTRGEPRGELRRLLQFALAGDGRKLVAAHDFTPPDVGVLVQRAPEGAPARSAPLAPAVHRVPFAQGSAALGDAERARLVPLAAEARRTGARLVVTGNCDSVGDPARNRLLARARASAVARAMIALGVRRDAVRVEERGADAPLATNGTAEGRRANRRVDVELRPAAGGNG